MGHKDCKSQRNRELSVGLCLLWLPEATHIKLHQHDCLSMDWTRTLIDMLKWMEESPWNLNPTRRPTEECREWGKQFFLGRSSTNCHPMSWSNIQRLSLKIYIQVILQMNRIIFKNMCIYYINILNYPSRTKVSKFAGFFVVYSKLFSRKEAILS